MDPFTLSAILNVGSNIFGGIFGGQQEEENRQMSEEQARRQLAQRQAEQGLMATQLDPFAQQRSRQRQAILGTLMQNFQPAGYDEATGRFTGGIMGITPDVLAPIQSFFGPNAMASQEQAFHQTAQAAAPTYQVPNYYGVGYQEGQGGLSPETPIGAQPRPTQTQEALNRVQDRFSGSSFASRPLARLSEHLTQVERLRNPQPTLGQPHPQSRSLADLRRQPGELERILGGR